MKLSCFPRDHFLVRVSLVSPLSEDAAVAGDVCWKLMAGVCACEAKEDDEERSLKAVVVRRELAMS